MITVLYTKPNSVYLGMPGVDCWDKQRDARLYGGTNVVIVHPPCARWGGYASVGGRIPGDDGGCGVAAVGAVRRCGGVLEHPARSGLFAKFMMPRPGTGCDLWGGETFLVHQAAYGHRALKPTWLYCVGLAESPQLATEFTGRRVPIELMGTAEREATPEPFARLLLSLVVSIDGAARPRSDRMPPLAMPSGGGLRGFGGRGREAVPQSDDQESKP